MKKLAMLFLLSFCIISCTEKPQPIQKWLSEIENEDIMRKVYGTNYSKMEWKAI